MNPTRNTNLKMKLMALAFALLAALTVARYDGFGAKAAQMTRSLPIPMAAAKTVMMASAAAFATITVNSNVDGTLDTLAANTTCDLREAVAAATSDFPFGQCPAGIGADTINFTITGTITLTAGRLSLFRDVTITGPGANLLAISGNNARGVFLVDDGVTASLSGLTVTGGFAH